MKTILNQFWRLRDYGPLSKNNPMFPKKLLKTEMPFSILFQNRIGGGRFLISTFYFFWELVKTNLSLCTFKKILSSITTTIVIFYIFLNSRNCRIDAKRIPGNPAKLSKQMFYGLKDCRAKSVVNYGQLFFM